MPYKTLGRAAGILAVIAVSCAMLAGLTYILEQHAQQAETYPAFSSFRTLPEGASVLYQALHGTPGTSGAMTAERNILPLGAVRYNHAAILMLGIQPASMPGWFGETEELAGQGNRVIIGLVPHRYRFIQPGEDQQTDALRHWNVRLAFVHETSLRDNEDDTLVAGWPMYFSQSTGWNVTRREGGRAVVIERAEGKGTLVLMANSYLLSNAAMVDDRQTAFLAGLIGPVHLTVFDETHFGIEETGSIAALARRYRLQGFLLGLAITAALFVWKSAAGFPPPSARDRLQSARSVTGEDSSAAFLNLLRRNIKRDEILATCVQAWRGMYQRKAGPGLAEAIDLAESGRRTPAQTYARIQQVLSESTGLGRSGLPGPHPIPADGAKHNQS